MTLSSDESSFSSHHVNMAFNDPESVAQNSFFEAPKGLTFRFHLNLQPEKESLIRLSKIVLPAVALIDYNPLNTHSNM